MLISWMLPRVDRYRGNTHKTEECKEERKKHKRFLLLAFVVDMDGFFWLCCKHGSLLVRELCPIVQKHYGIGVCIPDCDQHVYFSVMVYIPETNGNRRVGISGCGDRIDMVVFGRYDIHLNDFDHTASIHRNEVI